MQIEIVFHDGKRRIASRLKLPEGVCIRDALEKARLSERCGGLDLSQHRVGVYGKVKKLDVELHDGDRVEVYRPITCDPETVERRDEE